MKKLLLVLVAACFCWLVAAPLSEALANGGHKVCICHNPGDDDDDDDDGGDYRGGHHDDGDDDDDDDDDGETICISASAVPAHLRHGDSLGKCDEECGGDEGDTCDEDQFCKRDTGDCSESDEGVCTDIPSWCHHRGDPVCGCDGITYDNSCEAAAAGVSVDHDGECEGPQPCGGCAGNTCDDGEFCKPDDGVCDPGERGVCVAIPQTCPSTYDPVCGCDGTTYSNVCFANSAGVAVAQAGECPVGAACGGTAGGTCAAGEFCKPATGMCTAGADGTCTPIPAICSRILDPVCGCDGITYDNACEADTVSVAVDHLGECQPPQLVCGGTTGTVCAQGEFCERPVGECAEDVEGVCEETTTTCPAVIDPVCGCDGRSYSNDCVAQGAGVTVASDGVCIALQDCGGLARIACPQGMACQLPRGDCSEAATGICVPATLLCTVKPGDVCGCDGKTYFNPCFARAAGVNVNHDGACAPTVSKKKKKK